MYSKTGKFVAVVCLFITVIVLMACSTKVQIQLPVVAEAPDFDLTNQDGLQVSLSDYQGKVIVMDFIYTDCPDVCQDLGATFNAMFDQLDIEQQQDVVLISISFDTQVDTPEVLKQYANQKGFSSLPWQFLTGTVTQIDQIADDYGLLYEPVEDGHDHDHADEPSHRFSHNILVYLIDQEGMIRKKYDHIFFSEADMVSKIKTLLI